MRFLFCLRGVELEGNSVRVLGDFSVIDIVRVAVVDSDGFLLFMIKIVRVCLGEFVFWIGRVVLI